jgi:hypothetical protein
MDLVHLVPGPLLVLSPLGNGHEQQPGRLAWSLT